MPTVDEFTTTDIIADGSRAAIVLRIRVGDIEVTGVDDMTIDADELITRMSAQWHPLTSMAALQQRLVPLIGVPALELIEKRAA